VKKLFMYIIITLMFFPSIVLGKTNINEDFDILNYSIASSDCETLLGNPDDDGTPAFYMVIAFTVMKYAAIIILIVVTVMDFIGAAASQDNDALKKAMEKATTRIILCVIIFILPTLIEFVLKYIAETNEGLCGIK